MKRLIASLLLVASSLANAHQTEDLSVYYKAKQAFVTVSYPNSPGCGGTAIGPHHVMTSQHCLFYTQEMPLLNGQKVKVEEVARDTADGVILWTEMTFDYWVNVTSKPPLIGENVFVWNNPSVLQGILFKGYRSGEANLNILGTVKHFVTYEMNGFTGSSGSGIFNYRGELVGTVTAKSMWTKEDHENKLAMIMTLMNSQPYSFTPEQWAKTGITPRSRGK